MSTFIVTPVAPGQRNIKRVVAQAVADYLSNHVADLAGKVSAVQASPDKVQTYPSACLLGNTFLFEPFEPDEVYWDTANDDGNVIIDLGEFTGIFELQLYANSVPQRETVEQAIMDLFLSTQDAPGTLYVPTPNLIIAGYPSLYAPEIKVRLDNEEWREEFSFESRRYTFLDLEVSYPALVRRSAATIESLRTAINHDLEDDTSLETIEVQDDGTTEPST